MLISPAAQEWLEQGREEGVERGLEQGKRQILLDLITYRFGAPDPALRAALDTCNREQLSAISHIVLDASSAAEVLRNIRRMVPTDVWIQQPLTVAQIPTISEAVGKWTMLISRVAQEWLEKGREQGIEQGKAQGKRQLLIDLLTYRFGAPDAELREALDECGSEQLSAVSHIVLDAGSAAEVLHNIRQLTASAG